MGFKFTIEDNTERIITHNTQKDEVIILDYFRGFDVAEDEDNNDIFILYFKDIDRNLDVIQRYFKIEKKRLKDIKKNFQEYENKPTEKYLKLLALKKLSTNIKKSEEVYLVNENFFIACNITSKEWLQFSNFMN